MTIPISQSASKIAVLVGGRFECDRIRPGGSTNRCATLNLQWLVRSFMDGAHVAVQFTVSCNPEVAKDCGTMLYLEATDLQWPFGVVLPRTRLF